jgi:predicted DNA binding CopG/RHH family protein
VKPVQKFSDEYLRKCAEMSHEEIVRFLDDFRRLHGTKRSPSRLISIKVPEDLLAAFKAKARLYDVRYQTQIKKLMNLWLQEHDR